MMTYQEEQLKIFYLFLMADGYRSDQELSKFGEICKEMGISKQEKNEVVSFCKQKLNAESVDNSQTIMKIIKEILDDGGYLFGLNGDPEKQVNTIWNLISLGYADKEYSLPEQNIVNYLVETWNVDKKVVFEIQDTLDTMVALQEYKAWVRTTEKPYEEIARIQNSVNEDKENLLKNIKMTISEAKAG